MGVQTHPELLVALRRALKARRAEIGQSQEETARIADLARSYMSGVERGTINANVLNLQRLARAVNLNLSDLIARAERLQAD